MDASVKDQATFSRKADNCSNEDPISGRLTSLLIQVYSGDYLFPSDSCILEHLTSGLNIDINNVRQLLWAQEGKTLDRFLLEFKMDKVKELLVYTPYSLSEIALKLDFESAVKLRYQFEELTGLRPEFFIEIKKNKSSLVKGTEY
jgi:AraC-like DNA-binding protein